MSGGCLEKVSMGSIGCLVHSAPSWILSKAENLASSNLQGGATTWHYCHETTHPPAAHLFLIDRMTYHFEGIWRLCWRFLGSVRRVRTGWDKSGQVRKGRDRLGQVGTAQDSSGQVGLGQDRSK